MFSINRIIAVSLFVAVGAGGPSFVGTTDASVPSTPPDAATPSPSPSGTVVVRMLPDKLPADLPSGTIKTPLGRVRWVHLSGNPNTLPDPLQPRVGPSGLIWFDGGGSREIPCKESGSQGICTAAPRLWTSDDAVSGRVEHPLPVDAGSADLELEGDTYWLIATEPVGLWRSTDLTAWEQVDVSSLVSPGPTEAGTGTWRSGCP